MMLRNAWDASAVKIPLARLSVCKHSDAGRCAIYGKHGCAISTFSVHLESQVDMRKDQTAMSSGDPCANTVKAKSLFELTLFSFIFTEDLHHLTSIFPSFPSPSSKDTSILTVTRRISDGLVARSRVTFHACMLVSFSPAFIMAALSNQRQYLLLRTDQGLQSLQSEGIGGFRRHFLYALRQFLLQGRR